MNIFLKHVFLVLLIIMQFSAHASLLRSYLDDITIDRKLAELEDAKLGDTLFSNLDSGCSLLYNYTGLGYIDSVGEGACYQGGGNIVASFLLSDLYFSRLPGYENLPDIFDVRVHLTYLANTYAPEKNNADFRLYTQIGSDIDFNNSINASLIWGNTLVWETKRFSVNVATAYDFKINSELNYPVYSNIKGPGQHYGSGSVKVRLGGSPVFVLPTGYTANSVSGSIVNNLYTGFDPFANNSISVPEPSSLILLLIAMLLLAYGKYSKRTKNLAI